MSKEESVTILKSKKSRIAAVIAVLLALYGFAGFVLAPRLLRSALLEDIPKALGVGAAVGDIRVNPFLLRLTVEGLSLNGHSGERLVGFDRLFVAISPASLWRRAIVFRDIDIDAPYVGALVAADGSLNLLELEPKASPQPKAGDASQHLPRIQIGDLQVTRGVLAYEDRSRPEHFTTRLEPISFDLRDFSTYAEGGAFTFTAATKIGERVAWHGRLALQPVSSDGEFRIDGLQARTIWDAIEDRVGFVIDSGSIDLSAHYRFALRGAAEFNIDAAKLDVRDLAVGPSGSDPEAKPAWIALPHLEVDLAALDLAKRKVTVDQVSLTGLAVRAWRGADKTLNLSRLAAPPATGASQPPASAAPVTAPTAPTSPAASPPWTFDLRHFEVREANIVAEDRSVQPAARVVLAPLSLSIDGASLDFAQPVKILLDTKVNTAGALSVSGSVAPLPLAGDLEIKATKIALQELQPYLAERTSMTLLGGNLSADARIHLSQAKPAVKASANVSVADLHTVDNVLRKDFVNWDRLDVIGLRYQQGPDLVAIDRIVAQKPYARVIIESDHSFNVSRILAGPAGLPPSVPAAPVTPRSAAGKTPSAANTTSTAKTPATARTPRTGTTPAAPGAAPPLPMSIESIELEEGEANFADLSIAPNFAAGIQHLKGSIRGLSTLAKSRAQVDLHGEVEPFAPVSITGEINVLGPDLYTDIAVGFRNIDLSIFNPYSGKFAGYDISKGKLTTEFAYKIDGRKLDATHHIVIDQLEFGDKTGSKDAVSIPLRLAVALLKNADGVIDLELPIAGSLDDPKFQVWPVIWQVLRNVLVKAVEAPFALLGSLFGGGPDLQFVDFPAGSAALNSAGAEKMKAIVKALEARPQLKLEIPIAPLPESDGPALREAKFQAAVQAAMMPKSAPASAQASPGDASHFEQLDPSGQIKVLGTLYAEQTGHAPNYPAAIDAAEKPADAVQAKLAFLRSEVNGQIEVADADLKDLAEQRALALQQALLTDGALDPARVFLVASDKVKAENGAVRLELSLQ
jgi:hypothetical protein